MVEPWQSATFNIGDFAISFSSKTSHFPLTGVSNGAPNHGILRWAKISSVNKQFCIQTLALNPFIQEQTCSMIQ